MRKVKAMRLPSKEWIIAQIKKNFWKRLNIWLGLAIIGLLLDEHAKEGYAFRFADISSPFNHEFWVVVLSIIFVVNFLRNRLKGRDRHTS